MGGASRPFFLRCAAADVDDAVQVIGMVSDSVVVLVVSASRPNADEPLVSPDATPLLGLPAAAD